MNAYRGSRFELKTIFANKQHQSDGSYQSYYARFRSYYQIRDSLVLAWELNGCMKNGRIPLWDTCRLNLRGFPVTDYLSKKSILAQVEARWKFYKRWGLVAFAGGGQVDDSFGDHGENETIPSYGVGLRWMVLESQRINVRVDYARSNHGNSAWYLSISEAF
jgi:hemolysin activation/secretion protein